MKKAFPIALALLFTLGGGLAAQADGMHHGDMSRGGMSMHGHMGKMECMKGTHGGHFAYMSKELNLTKEQQNKARAIFDKAHQEMRPLYKEKHELSKQLSALDPASRGYDSKVKQIARKQGELTEKMAISRAEIRKQFHMLLTPEQRTKAMKIMKDRQKMREDRMRMHEDRMKMRNDMHGDGHGMSM